MAEPTEVELGLESSAPLVHDEPARGVAVTDIRVEEGRFVGAGVPPCSGYQAAGVRRVERLEERADPRPERVA